MRWCNSTVVDAITQKLKLGKNSTKVETRQSVWMRKGRPYLQDTRQEGLMKKRRYKTNRVEKEIISYSD